MIWEASSALVFQHQPFMLIEGKQINVYMCAKVNWTYKEYECQTTNLSRKNECKSQEGQDQQNPAWSI